MRALRNWRVKERTANHLMLEVENGHIFQICVLEEDLIRVTLLREGKYRMGRTWSIAPSEDVSWAGRSREDLRGFTCPPFTVKETAEGLRLETATLCIEVRSPLALVWFARRKEQQGWTEIASDRPQDAYLLGRKDHRNQHCMCRFPDEYIYGLGEKSGPLERSNRRFEMRNLDALGYDARTTDPLYKHIPVTFTERAQHGAYSLFYDTLAHCWFDLGNEKDNYHPAFRSFRAADGDLQFYFCWGETLLDVVKRHQALIGGTAFMPRWGLGYSGSTMAYTDSENAQERVLGFLDKIAAEDMPCDSFQLSSGYTAINDKRYVFNWNTSRFPNAEQMGQAYALAKVHLIANIKPVLLLDHPLYKEAQAAGLFIEDSETGNPEQSPFWDGYGSHLDFTNEATVKWWQSNLKDKLFSNGINSTWNDNNEYEVWDDAAKCHGFGEEIPVNLIRPLHGLLMTRASFEAQCAHDPQTRPYLVSRSVAPGTQRYAQTWTGDNTTSWETLRWNIPMGLGLSLSGFFNIGHDVGGFAGPRPDPELFLRWVQNGIFHPRFTIHSWNDDGTANEPWMHPEVTHLVREALKFRARLIPYLYTLLQRAVTRGEPILRPLCLDYPGDPNCRNAEFDFLLGCDLLVATVVEKGALHRRVTLPANETGWWSYDGAEWFPGGQVIDVPVGPETIPLFVRGGAVIPLAAANARSDAASDRERTWALYPPPAKMGPQKSQAYDDDGISVGTLDANHCLTLFELSCEGEAAHLVWSTTGQWRPAFSSVKCWVAGTLGLQVNDVPVVPGSIIAFKKTSGG